MKCTCVQPSLHPKIIEEGRVNLKSVEYCLQIDCNTAGKNQNEKEFFHTCNLYFLVKILISIHKHFNFDC